MQNLIAQLQMLLAAVSAFLPLIPDDQRSRAADLLDLAAAALGAGAAASDNIADLAAKLASVRADVEGMARDGADVAAFDASLNRVRAASAAFRDAAQQAQSGG